MVTSKLNEKLFPLPSLSTETAYAIDPNFRLEAPKAELFSKMQNKFSYACKYMFENIYI